MAKLQEERRLAIDTAITDIATRTPKGMTTQAIIRGATDLLTGSHTNLKALPCAVYDLIRYYVKIGRLTIVKDRLPITYILDKSVEVKRQKRRKNPNQRNIKNNIFENMTGEDVIKMVSTFIRNAEVNPEISKDYQHRIAELTEEIIALKTEHEHKITVLKTAHEQELAHAKVEYKKVLARLDNIVTLAKV